MSRGNITRRGKASWRLKFDIGRDPVTGKRITRLVTVRGKRQDAERELTKLLTAADNGTLVEPSKTTLGDYINAFLDTPNSLAGKTIERYRQLAEQQIIPHLGPTLLQKLRPAQIADWHTTLLKAGGKNGRPLSPTTVSQAHRVLHRILARAAATEVVSRNVASAVSPPRKETEEIECLTQDQVAAVLAAMKPEPLHPIVSLALGSGMRRGEILGLRWADIDLEGAQVRVERSLEETKAGLRLKAPKTKHGRRTISLPGTVVEDLRSHRRRQLELRLMLGMGRPDSDALVFAEPDGSLRSPVAVSGEWRSAVARLKLPKVTFHALRHSHASALIAEGLDVLTISRRLGHASPVVTLTVYAHLFRNTDAAAAKVMEGIMGTVEKQ